MIDMNNYHISMIPGTQGLEENEFKTSQGHSEILL